MMPSKTQTAEAAAPSQQIIFYQLCLGFVLNGIIITFVGPMLTVLKAKWSLNDGQAGLFSTAQFAASLVGVLASSPLMSRKGFKPAIVAGIAMQGIGFALLNAPTFALALVACAVFGLGYGFVTPGTNLWVGESFGERRATALSIVNLAWGAGAILSAPLTYLTVRTNSVPTLLYIVGAVCILLALTLLRMPFGKPQTPQTGSAEESRGPLPFGLLAMLGILFFVYVGTENSTSFWAAEHARRAAAWPPNTFAFTFAPMFFFAGLLSGRGVAAAVLLRVREGSVAVSGILLAAAGLVVFLLAHSPIMLFFGALLAGLGLASLYPVYIAWLSKWLGARARKVGGAMFALAAAGASTMPTLVGVVSKYTSSLRLGLLVPLLGCAVMLAVVLALRPNSRS